MPHRERLLRRETNRGREHRIRRDLQLDGFEFRWSRPRGGGQGSGDGRLHDDGLVRIDDAWTKLL